MKDIELQKLGKYLRENDIKVDEAKDILKRALEINPTNIRSLWKMKRFGMYIAQRIDEDKQGLLGKKIESVRRIAASKNYIDEYKKQDAPKFYRQVAADGVTVDEDKWNMNKKYIEKEAKKALTEYNKVKKDIEKELKQYL